MVSVARDALELVVAGVGSHDHGLAVGVVSFEGRPGVGYWQLGGVERLFWRKRPHASKSPECLCRVWISMLRISGFGQIIGQIRRHSRNLVRKAEPLPETATIGDT